MQRWASKIVGKRVIGGNSMRNRVNRMLSLRQAITSWSLFHQFRLPQLAIDA